MQPATSCHFSATSFHILPTSQRIRRGVGLELPHWQTRPLSRPAHQSTHNGKALLHPVGAEGSGVGQSNVLGQSLLAIFGQTVLISWQVDRVVSAKGNRSLTTLGTPQLLQTRPPTYSPPKPDHASSSFTQTSAPSTAQFVHHDPLLLTPVSFQPRLVVPRLVG